MEKTGLLNKFLNGSTAIYKATVLLEQSAPQQALNSDMDLMLGIYKETASTRDISLIMIIENMTLRFELENRANSPEEVNSIKMALLQMDDAQRSLAVVKDHAAYASGADMYSTRQKEAGLPLDAFREFVKSHTTRLSNRLSSPLPMREKNLLRQRKENMQVIKEVYVELQKEALG